MRLLGRTPKVWRKDGLNTCSYSTLSVERSPLYINVTVDIGEPMHWGFRAPLFVYRSVYRIIDLVCPCLHVTYQRVANRRLVAVAFDHNSCDLLSFHCKPFQAGHVKLLGTHNVSLEALYSQTWWPGSRGESKTKLYIFVYKIALFDLS